MSNGVSSTPTVLLYLLAILLPPVAVFLDTACSVDFVINICLTILGWIPGILHAWYVIAKNERSAGTAVPTTRRGAVAPAPAPPPVPVEKPYPAPTAGPAATQY